MSQQSVVGTPLVLDFGANYLKCGEATDSSSSDPKICPSVIAAKISYGGCQAAERHDLLFGDLEALKEADGNDRLTIYNPMSNGFVSNWNHFGKVVFQLCFYEFGRQYSPEERPALMSLPTDCRACRPAGWQYRGKIAEYLFESMDFPSLFIGDSSKFAMLSQGASTGIVLEVGAESTIACAVYEGHAIPWTCQRLKIAGNQLSAFLRKFHAGREIFMEPRAGKLAVDELKESRCYVALDYEEEMLRISALGPDVEEFKLPDGSELTIGVEKFKVPEALFRPELLLPTPAKGIHELVADCLLSCHDDLRDMVGRHLYVSGGGSQFRGLDERLRRELCKIEVDGFSSDDLALSNGSKRDRRLDVYNGGVIYSCLDSMSSNFVTKDEYDDAGERVIHRKCN